MKPKFIYCGLLSLLVLPFSLLAQQSLTFQVNMSYQTSRGNFNPETEFVDVAGTFTAWGDAAVRLADEDGDLIYEAEITGLTVGETLEYKFRINGAWNGREEFAGGGPNRSYTVQAGETTLLHWYNDEFPDDADLMARFSVTAEIYAEGTVRFEDQSIGTPTEWEWTFEGGEPSTSTAANPAVRYNEPGTYDVQLIARKEGQVDTLLLENHMNIKVRDTEKAGWWNDAVFYEIFVRSFYDSDGDGIGDFRGIIEKLDYLNDGDPATTDDLGVTGLWLMPIHESRSYHGYDVNDYRSVSTDFGTMEDFKALLDAAHERGIRIIIDFVMNHTSDEHPWFQEAKNDKDSPLRSFYRWEDNEPNYNGPWGQDVWHGNAATGYYYGLFSHVMPDLNYENPAVQDSMFALADYWLEDIGIDGFRLDAVRYIDEDGQQAEDTPQTLQFWKDFRAHYKETKADAFSVGESWADTETVLEYVDNDHLDHCFEFDLSYSMLSAARDGNATGVKEQIQKVYNLYPHLQFGTFLTNHDQNRLMNELDQDPEKVKLAAAMYLTFPGIPYVYYGNEIGMTGLKPDENIRRPMSWSSGTWAGFSSSSAWIQPTDNYRQYNVAAASGDQSSILNRYRGLINLRNQEIALRRGNYSPVATDSDNVLAFARRYEDEVVVVMINVGTSYQPSVAMDFSFLGLPAGSYQLQSLFGTGGDLSLELSADMNWRTALNARQVRVMKVKTVTKTDELVTGEKLNVYPNPATESVWIQRPQRLNGTAQLSLFNLQGQLVQQQVWAKGEAQHELSVRNLQPGMYILRLNGTGKVWSERLVVR